MRQRKSKQNSLLVMISVRLRGEEPAQVRNGITGCINDGYKQICKRNVPEERTPHSPLFLSLSLSHPHTHSLFIVLLQMWINTGRMHPVRTLTRGTSCYSRLHQDCLVLFLAGASSFFFVPEVRQCLTFLFLRLNNPSSSITPSCSYCC